MARKGENILVRLSDRRAVLVDFGSCHFQGAERLTWQSLPPVTPEYLSSQAVLFYIHSLRHPEGYYPPSAADDLYALGVTAYRLVMGQYPARIDARQDEQGAWNATSPDPRPMLESNPQVEPALREVIVRLLSSAPEARGTATQVAEALEAGAGGADERRGLRGDRLRALPGQVLAACTRAPQEARAHLQPWAGALSRQSPRLTPRAAYMLSPSAASVQISALPRDRQQEAAERDRPEG
jgi:serine/threonine protein kinase